jgi:hypothetical protein
VKGGEEGDQILLKTNDFEEVYKYFNFLRRFKTTNNIRGNTCYYNSTTQIILKQRAFLKYAFRENVSPHWFRPLLRTLFCGYYLAEYIQNKNFDFEKDIYTPILDIVLQQYTIVFPGAVMNENGFACPTDLLTWLVSSITKAPGEDVTAIFGSATRTTTHKCNSCDDETEESETLSCLEIPMLSIPNNTFTLSDGEVISTSFVFDEHMHVPYGDTQDEPLAECEQKECSGKLETTKKTTFSDNIELIVITITRRVGSSNTEEADANYEMEFKPTQNFLGLGDYDLAGFMVYKDRHVIGFVKLESSWFEVDDNSTRTLDLPVIQKKFAQQAVLAFYVRKSDLANNNPEKPLPCLEIVDLDDCETNVRPALLITVDCFKAYRHILTSSSTNRVKILCARALHELNLTEVASSDGFFVVHHCPQIVVETYEVNELVLSEEKIWGAIKIKKSVFAVFDDNVAREPQTEKKQKKKVKEMKEIPFQEKVEGFTLIVVVTEKAECPNFWCKTRNGRYVLLNGHETKLLWLKDIMTPKCVVIKSLCYVRDSEADSVLDQVEMLRNKRKDETKDEKKEQEQNLLKQMLLSFAPTFLADFKDTDYLFIQAGYTDQKITDEFTLIALVKNSEEGVYIREPSDFESCRFWMVNKKVPKVVEVDITAKCFFKNHHTLHIKHNCLSEVSGKIQEIIDFGTLTQNITSLCGFFKLNPETVARRNLHQIQLGKRSKSVPPYTVLTELIASNKAVLVLYCKSEDGFMASSFDKQSSSSFDSHGKTYYLMAYVSIDTSGNAKHYVRFDKNTLTFQSKDCISPYTTPPHAPFEESKCYVWMYIADSCNDQIKMSSLNISVSYITQDFESILKRFGGTGTRPFTTTNLVTVVIDGAGSVVKDPTPESLITRSNSDPPQIFVEIVNRSGNDRKYNYSDCIPTNYFLMAILQQHTKWSRSKGSSIKRKIWFRYKKEDLEFINIKAPNEEQLQWNTASKSIPSEGVVFVYSLDKTW